MQCSAIYTGMYGCCGQPAGMAAHDFNDGNRFCIVNRSVQSDFTDGSSHIFCGTAESLCVVGEDQVVVDRFRNTHDTYINVVGSSIAGKLADRIPGIRPGKPTQDYLEKILNYIIFIGAIGLLIVCTIPIVFNGAFGASVSFGGTSIIIIVGVVLETLKQIESQMLVRNYRGFLSE